MRSDVEIEVSAADRARLEAIVAAPSSPQKHVWRARIILLSADGVGTMAIARRAGVANRFIEAHNHDPKPFVWTADPERILHSVRRGNQTLETIH
jgi:hypothetical protein